MGTQEQRRAQILATLQPEVSASSPSLRLAGSGGSPAGSVAVNSSLSSVVQPARRIVVNTHRSPPSDGRRTTVQPDAHGLPREAGGRQKRLLGAYVGFPNSGPPSSTCSHRQARSNPSGTRLGTTTPVEHSNSKRIRSL